MKLGAVCSSIVAMIALTTTSPAQVLNVTANGTPIMGLAASDAAIASGKDGVGNAISPSDSSYGYTTNGYVAAQMERGGTTDASSWPGWLPALVDGKTTTYSDTEYDGNLSDPLTHPFGSAYVGMKGLAAISALHPVTTIKLVFELDLYGTAGSYFGDNGTGDVYKNGGATDATLHLPSSLTLFMQTTTDGVNWVNQAFTTDYTTVMNGLDVGNGTTAMLSPTVTFTLDGLANGMNIQGIRVIGTVGGGRDDGMLGIADMIVETPEPSTYAMIALGTVALLGLARFARRTA